MPDNIRPEKIILYKLCQFLIALKLDPVRGKGVNRPITIKLKEFFVIFETVNDTTIEMHMNKLKEELMGLIEQEISTKNNPLIQINDKEIFNDFLHNVQNDKEIILTYQSLELENYLNILKEGDARRTVGENYNRLIFTYQNGKGFFSYKGKIMKVRKNEKTKSIRLNICLLLFKLPATHLISRDTLNSQTAEEVDIFSEYPNYQVGDKVHAGSLVDIILIREDEENRIMLPAHDNFRQIHDAVRGINSNAKINLGIKKIFNYADQDVSVDENILPLIVL